MPEPDRSRSFVFYEPSVIRWRRFIRLVQGGGILTFLALVSALVGVLVTPELPAVVLPDVPHLLPLSHAHELTGDQRGGPDALSPAISATLDPESPSPSRPPLVLGYYV